jgi:hypothetical protein
MSLFVMHDLVQHGEVYLGNLGNHMVERALRCMNRV